MIASQRFEHRAVAAGLTEPLIRKVIDSFYEKVRRDEVLGPVFNDAIGDHWEAHIERIVLFWLTVTQLGTGYQSRNFMPAHLHNKAIRAELLPRWLKLFRETVGAECSPQAAAVLVDIAARMAESLNISLEKRDRT
ncbi:MAG TPA: group III truncated hemoglobin [Xanthobacteraceae bacterium]|nr:group III truncated hemoglobin [Xanthobacteraceae bacterium]